MAFKIDWIQIHPEAGQPPKVTAHYHEPHPREPLTGQIGGGFSATSALVVQRARALAQAVRDEIAAAYNVIPDPVD